MNFAILGSRPTVPTIVQSEASECGLASMAMVARYFGQKVDLTFMRALNPVSRRGMTFSEIVELANKLGFDARGFALTSIDELSKVALPAILHWDGNHFVVLESITAKGYTVHDPAFGKRLYAAEDMARHFSGVVLEIEPRMDFVRIKSEKKSSLWPVLKSCRGLESSIVQMLVVSMAVGLLALMTPILLQVSLDVVLPQFDLDLLTIVTIGLALFLIFEAAGRWLRDHIILRSSLLFQTYFTRNIIGHAFRLPLSFFESRHPGDIVARLDSIDAIKTYLVRGLVASLADSLMSVLSIALMFYYSPSMTAAVLGTLIILLVLRFSFFPALKLHSNASLEAHSEERSNLLDGLRRADALKVHNSAELHTAKWYESFVRFANADFKAKSVELKAEVTLHVILAISTVLTLYYGVAAVMQSTLSVGMLYAFFALRQSFFQTIDRLTTELLHLSILDVHFQRIDDVISQTPEIASHVGAIDRVMRKSVRVENVTVQFGKGDEPLLTNVDLSIDIAGGESIAIVGPSGCGKSSLLKIIASLHEPYVGQLLIDDQPVRNFGLAEYRGNLGAVFANDGVFSGTIAENLSLFHPEVTRAAMEKALLAVGLFDEISKLPQGFATRISEETTVLSTGQRRRLLAARAICRAPRLYLLDEVTANLDPASERALVDGLIEQPGAKVFVTHSPALLKSVDTIYRVEGGRLVRSTSLKTFTGSEQSPVL